MAAFSDFLETALLNHTLRGNIGGTSYAQPATVYVALFTTATDDAGGGTEVTGGSYARQGPLTFTVPASGQVANTVDIIFPTATAGWGTVTHVGIYDAVTAGNRLYHGPLATSKTVNNGDSFRFVASQLVVGLS